MKPEPPPPVAITTAGLEAALPAVVIGAAEDMVVSDEAGVDVELLVLLPHAARSIAREVRTTAEIDVRCIPGLRSRHPAWLASRADQLAVTSYGSA
jgi:hypothetical protein